jgi:UDP-4-amino-4,6-dideoxy-N-acetyl-beta-L-altrosamine N-acetyltransferase
MRIICGFGLTLRQLQLEDIEMVRLWRNDPSVSSHMLTQDHISKPQQERWFRSVDNESNHLFIIELSQGPVGMCGLKKIDRENMSAEGIIYIYDEKFRNSPHCVAVAVMLGDYAFRQLDLKTIYAQILDKNVRAVRFNKLLGNRLLSKGEGGLSTYILTRDSFRTASAKIRPSLDKMFGSPPLGQTPISEPSSAKQ